MLFKRRSDHLEGAARGWTPALWGELKAHRRGVHGIMMIEQMDVNAEAEFGASLAQSTSIFSGRLGCEANSPLRAVKATLSFHTDEHLGSARLSQRCVGWLKTVIREETAELHLTVRATVDAVDSFVRAFERAKLFGAPFIPVWFWQDDSLDELEGDDGKFFARTAQMERIMYSQALGLTSSLSQDGSP
jgi:hypothetical protein